MSHKHDNMTPMDREIRRNRSLGQRLRKYGPGAVIPKEVYNAAHDAASRGAGHKSKALKRKAGGSLLRYALGKSDADWEGSDSYRAIHDKHGNVRRNINR